MKSHINHIQINIDFEKNHVFYKELMTFLGWEVIFETKGIIGYKSGDACDLWFIDSQKKGVSDYDNIGVNHIGLKVEKQADVDSAVSFLKSHGIKALFDTPRHRPEFSHGEGQTYYQVIFETPDRMQFEIVFSGKKA